MDTLSLRMDKGDACGLMLSGELLGALALGFQGEIGNFIFRYTQLVSEICESP